MSLNYKNIESKQIKDVRQESKSEASRVQQSSKQTGTGKYRSRRQTERECHTRKYQLNKCLAQNNTHGGGKQYPFTL